jgi:hypothetical protein
MPRSIMNVQLCPVGMHTNNPSPNIGVMFLKKKCKLAKLGKCKNKMMQETCS